MLNISKIYYYFIIILVEFPKYLINKYLDNKLINLYINIKNNNK